MFWRKMVIALLIVWGIVCQAIMTFPSYQEWFWDLLIWARARRASIGEVNSIAG